MGRTKAYFDSQFLIQSSPIGDYYIIEGNPIPGFDMGILVSDIPDDDVGVESISTIYINRWWEQ